MSPPGCKPNWRKTNSHHHCVVRIVQPGVGNEIWVQRNPSFAKQSYIFCISKKVVSNKIRQLMQEPEGFHVLGVEELLKARGVLPPLGVPTPDEEIDLVMLNSGNLWGEAPKSSSESWVFSRSDKSSTALTRCE